ncbi:NUDIX domain-containing protein [Cellulomonas sp. URHD0024]|uniref:NUDIX domain-containing protein n=1 Tax=Cellulomonas sp. URHD0024 TaxID=1302620 RepID=UPI000421B6B0|nr:NUDIX hydrolase [Cellulomonas sp. URHD0024]
MHLVSTSTSHSNPWFTVERRQYESESGTRHPYFMVCRPDSVLVAARRDGRYVLVEQSRPTMDGARSLEFPQGSLSGDESPDVAARREVREETGLELAGLRHVGTFAESNGFATSSCHAFVAEVGGVGEPDRDLFEADMEMHLLSWPRLRELVAAGAVRDSATLAALALIEARGHAG